LEEGDLIVAKQISLFESFTIPVWIFDVDRSRIYWANDAAIALWDANSLADLCARDMAHDMSPSVRTRLVQYQEEFLLGHSHIEPWTLYPKGQPRTFKCHFSGIKIDQNRIALLGMALADADQSDSETLRSSQALLLTSVMVSLYEHSGKLIYANPAARTMLGINLVELSSRFVDPTNFSELIYEVDLKGEFRAECLVNTVHGEFWHEITVQYGPDAVTGSNAYLVSETDISMRRAAQQQAHLLAYNDGLTGLVNRVSLVEQLDRELQLAKRYKQTLAVLFLDLDRFKPINDTLGHDVGDELLIGVAESLVDAVYETDTVSRLGGDEFICILRDLSSPASVAKTASRILQQIAVPKAIGDRELIVTTSIGISVYPADGDSSRILMKHADIAMYQSKAQGGNTATYFDAEMNQASETRMLLEAELRKAQQANEFEVYYQPRVDAVNHKTIGVEALLRWNHPQRGLLDAGVFITVAEEAGMLIEIDHWVLQQAAQQQVIWQQQGFFLKVSINMSARQFKTKDLLPRIERTLQQTGCSAKDLELEITESVYMGSERPVLQLLEDIRATGLSLSVDDFGTGYSNLGYLKDFPIDSLKIDQKFVQDDGSHALLKWIASLGKLLNVRLIAEGVETEEQLKRLKGLDCEEYQGYYFSRPISANAISRLIVQQKN
jgi:diguanylate cyclase (GGDEF)-like protein